MLKHTNSIKKSPQTLQTTIPEEEISPASVNIELKQYKRFDEDFDSICLVENEDMINQRNNNNRNSTGSSCSNSSDMASPYKTTVFSTNNSNEKSPNFRVQHLRELQQLQQQHKKQAPIDKYNLFYLLFVLHGITVLLPWNMFITAKSYFVDIKLSSPEPISLLINKTKQFFDFDNGDDGGGIFNNITGGDGDGGIVGIKSLYDHYPYLSNSSDTNNFTFIASLKLTNETNRTLVFDSLDQVMGYASTISSTLTLSDSSAFYITYFIPLISILSQIPNLFFNWLNIYLHINGNLNYRIICCLIIEICLFLITMLFIICDVSYIKGVFFWITMVTVTLLNIATGIYQNSIFGLAAKLPIKYTNAILLGTNFSGVFVTLVQITSTMIFQTELCLSTFVYFFIAVLILCICLVTTILTSNNKFYEFYQKCDLTIFNNSKKVFCCFKLNSQVPYKLIFKSSFKQLTNIFLTFFITLTIFPSIYSEVKIYDTDNFIISNKYFTLITCFLTFNLFAMIGNFLTNWWRWPDEDNLIYFVFSRFLFVPLFLMCNIGGYNKTSNTPFFILNDWIYWLIGILMSFTSGYFSSLGMMYASKSTEPRYSAVAGMFASASLITGISAGIVFSIIIMYFN